MKSTDVAKDALDTKIWITKKIALKVIRLSFNWYYIGKIL